MPFKTFTSATLSAADVNDYLMEQAVITCTSSTRPTGTDGMVIYETDTKRFYVFEDSVWNTLGGSVWVAFTPSWAGVTTTSATQDFEYRYVPGGMRIRGVFLWGASTAWTAPVMTIPNSESTRSTGGGALGVIACADATSSANNRPGYALVGESDSDISFASTGGALGATTPFTWASGDSLWVDITIPL